MSSSPSRGARTAGGLKRSLPRSSLASRLKSLSASFLLVVASAQLADPALRHARLDERDDGGAIQDYLLEKTGQRTVPNIFVRTSFVFIARLGAHDDVTHWKHRPEACRRV